MSTLVPLPAHHMRVSFHHSGGDVTGEMINTQYFECGSIEEAPGSILSDIADAWKAQLNHLHCTNITFTHASAMWNDPILGMEALDSVVTGGTGAQSTPMAPLNLACIIQKHTAFAGRKFRGRMFFGGFPASVFSTTHPNRLADTFVDAAQGFANAFQAACITVHANPVLVHPVGGPTPTLVTAYQVVPLLANMRKRIR